MYTFDQSKLKDSRKRDFKFQRKGAQPKFDRSLNDLQNSKQAAANLPPVNVKIEWPRELEPVLQPLSEIKTKSFHSVVEKVKGYILAENLKIVLENFKEKLESSQTEFEACLKKWQMDDLFSFTKSQLLNNISNKMNVEACWTALRQKVSDQLAVFDSNSYCDALPQDQIITRLIEINTKVLVPFIHQIENVVNLSLKLLGKILQEKKIGRFQAHLNLTLVAWNIAKSQQVKKITHNIDFRSLIHRYLDFLLITDQNRQQQSWDDLLNCIVGESVAWSLAKVNITKVRMTIYKTIDKEFFLASKEPSWYARQIGYERPKPANLAYDASMGLYAISRARVQYLSSCIPLFRFRHALFEALIATVHEQELRPLSSTDEDVSQLQNPIQQERFLLRKYLEFMSHPTLNQLLILSLRGDTLGFVRSFNSISDLSCPLYSQYKISLYDINQRKFIIENDKAPKECYLVHYNGLVFGANFAKMIIIREREVQLSQLDEEEDSSKSSSEESSQEEQAVNEDEFGAVSDSNQSQSMQNYTAPKTSVLDLIKQENNESSDEEKNEVTDEQILNVKSGFVLSSSHLTLKQRRLQLRQQMNLKQGKEDHSTFKNLVGMMAIKIYFDEEDPNKPKRLFCYGSLPLKQNLMTKMFAGEKCHIKFLLWALQNVTDYKIDNRIDQTLFSIFTIGGASKEFPLLLRGLVQLSGRDSHFFGDLNKVRCLWHDNIKFYDLRNYFEDCTLTQLANEWLPKQELEKSSDKAVIQTRETKLTYEVAQKFLKEIQAIYFNKNSRKFDFYKFQQATASGIALSVYQFLYLDYQQEIKGTMDLEILQKEQNSIVIPYLFINKLNQTQEDIGVQRLYKMNRLMSHLHVEQPIPYVFKGFSAIEMTIDFKSGVQFMEQKQNQFLKLQIPNAAKEYTLHHTSLYKVSHLSYKTKQVHSVGHMWHLHHQIENNSNFKPCVLIDKYIWGVELIYGIKTQSIEKLIVTEEIQYYQSRYFSKFVEDICDKIQKCQDKCQMNILEMIIDSFTMKFGQKCYNSQQVLHINDLKSLKQPRNLQWQADVNSAPRRRIVKIFEMQHPFYYCEFQPRESDKLTQIGSLARLTGFLNAAHRVKLMQSLSSVDLNTSIVYLDTQYLLIRNGSIGSQNSFTLSQHRYNTSELGKWLLLIESSLNCGIKQKPENEQFTQVMTMLKQKLPNTLQSFQESDFLTQYKEFALKFTNQEEVSVIDKFIEWQFNKLSGLAQNPTLFNKTLQPSQSINAEWLKMLSRGANFVDLIEGYQVREDTNKDSTNLEKSPCEFINKLLTTKATTNQAVLQLANAVRHFETQFAQGKLDAIVFDECELNDSNKQTDKKNCTDSQTEDLKNPAYPAGHPMNAKFDFIDTNEQAKKKEANQNLNNEDFNKPSSPLGLSESSNSSFTANLIAQKFNIGPNDPILNFYMGDDTKGDLVKSFFESTPLHSEQKKTQNARKKTFETQSKRPRNI